MNGDEIFERMAQKYADCGSYTDIGKIEHALGVTTFKTFFVRPNLFKFEFSRDTDGDKPASIIWSDGNEFFANYNTDLNYTPSDNYSSLLLEIGVASQPPLCLAPMMLMPDFAAMNALVYAGPYEIAEHTSIADRSCNRIKSSNADFPYTADLLIDSLGHKMRRMIIDAGSGLESEVTFQTVSFDKQISEDIFNIKR